jgi:hypothetical protein
MGNIHGHSTTLAVSLVPSTPVTPVTPIAPVVSSPANGTVLIGGFGGELGGGFGGGFGGEHGGSFGGFGGAAITPQGYGFTISGTQVTAMDRVFGTLTFNMNLPSNAAFAVDTSTNTVTETLAGTNASETIQYTTDPTNASLYHIAQETETITNPATTNIYGRTDGYSFTISSANQVTAMQKVSGFSTYTFTHNIQLSPAATFAVSGTGTGSTVTETALQGNTIATTQFALTSSGLYAVASESTTFVQPGTATTLLSVNPFDRANFTVDASGNVTQVQSVSPIGTATTITPSSLVTFHQIAAGFVQETLTYGAYSSYDVFYQGGSGPYTEVAHGSGTTVDLIGLQHQLATLPSALVALI